MSLFVPFAFTHVMSVGGVFEVRELNGCGMEANADLGDVDRLRLRHRVFKPSVEQPHSSCCVTPVE